MKIEAVSELNEITALYLNEAAITAAYLKTAELVQNILRVPELFIALSALIEVSLKLTNNYESKSFNFSGFAQNLYTMLSAINDNFMAARRDMKYLSTSIDNNGNELVGMINDLRADVNTISTGLSNAIDNLCSDVNTLSSDLSDIIDDLRDDVNTISSGLSDAIDDLRIDVNMISTGLSDAISSLQDGQCEKYLRILHNESQNVDGPVNFTSLLTGTITNALTAEHAKWS